MKKIIPILTAFIAHSAFAETAGPVSYSFPENKPWQLTLDQPHQGGFNRIYIPAGTDKASAKEYFAVVTTDKKDLSGKLEDIEAGLKANLPEHEIKVKIIEENPNDITYEWSASKGTFQISGITKGFNTHPGAVILTYQTFGALSEEMRTLWIKQLAQALSK